MTTRDSPRSSSSVAPVRPLRRRWTGATAAAAAVPMLVLALVGRADACSVKVVNHLNYNLNMDVFNGWDGICSDPLASFTLSGYGGCTCDRCCVPLLGLAGLGWAAHFPPSACLAAQLHSSHAHERRLVSPSLPSPPIPDYTADCIDANACKFKIQGPGNCDGTVLVSCGNELRFYYDSNGNPTFNTPADSDDQVGRTLWETEREAEDAAKEAFLTSLVVARGGGIADVASSSSVGEGVVDDGASGSGLRGTKGSKRIL